jgi:hypothetical protein
MLTDVATPGDRNVIKKQAETILKYKYIIIEIQSTWSVRAKVILVRVMKGATGTISESLRQYLSNIPGKREIRKLKKSHIGHYTHIAESANIKVRSISRAK